MSQIDPQFICETGRYKELAKYDAYYEGTQYDKCHSLKDWWDDTVPMHERKPCIIYPLPKAAVQQATRFALGEGKFPKLKVAKVDAKDEFDPRLALSAKDVETLESGLADLVKRSRLATAMKAVMKRGLSSRTGVVALGLRDGQFFFEHPLAKDCLPTFANNDPTARVTGLIWANEYEAVVPDKKGHPQTKRFRFRRDYTDTTIVEYEPSEIETGKPTNWIVKDVTEHGLGECPVIWTPNLAGSGCKGVDGISLYENLFDQFDALNRTLSQRHSGIEILGVPQPYETGVAKGDGPGQVGRSAAEPKGTDPRANLSGYSSASAPPTDGPHKARKAGARHLWTYRGENVKVNLLETTGKAFEVATLHVQDVRSRLLEAMDVILLDPTAVAGKGDMSAKALALMYAPMLALVDDLREWWWDHCISRTLEMMLRIIARLRGRGIMVRGAERMAKILSKRTLTVEDGSTIWVAPDIEPLWGAYFSPSAEETKTEVETAAMAKAKGLISAKTATQFVANNFGIPSVDDELDAIEDESEAEREQGPQTMPPTPQTEPIVEVDEEEADEESADTED